MEASKNHNEVLSSAMYDRLMARVVHVEYVFKPNSKNKPRFDLYRVTEHGKYGPADCKELGGACALAEFFEEATG